MEFKTKVQIFLYDHELTSESGKKRTVGVINGHAVLSWSLEIEARSWGVKGMYPIVPDQTIEAEVEVDNEEGDSETVTLSLPLKDVMTSVVPDQYGMIAPHSLTLYKNKWEVE